VFGVAGRAGRGFCAVRHRGSLTIQGNASLVIADCVYEQDGDVVVGGNGVADG